MVAYWLTMLVDYNKAVVFSSEHQDFCWVKVKEARKLSSYSNFSKLKLKQKLSRWDGYIVEEQCRRDILLIK